MSLSSFVSGGKATTKAIVEDTPVDKPASKPAPAKVAGKKPGVSKKSPSSSKRRESLSELPSFPEFVEGARTPAERIVPPKDTLETIYGSAKSKLVPHLGEGVRATKDMVTRGPIAGGFDEMRITLGKLDDPDYDEAGRRKSNTRPQASGVFSAPAVTGSENFGGRENTLPITQEGLVERVSNALARASTDRQNAEDALEEMEKTGADEDKIAQGRRDLLHAQRVYTQLVNIRDKTLPRREQLKGLYDSMSE